MTAITALDGETFWGPDSCYWTLMRGNSGPGLLLVCILDCLNSSVPLESARLMLLISW